MIVRLGYVAISKSLENVTTSHSLNYTNFINNKENIYKIYEQIKKNLSDLDKILKFNIKNNIHFYRLTSKLIPLATHKDVKFDYQERFKDKFKELGKLINDNNLRIDMHPDQFTVLNSTKKEVLENTLNILKHEYEILDLLGIKNKVIILHVGSNVFGKEPSIKRFINNFNKLPECLRKSIVLENDDKTFNVLDVLSLCKKLNIPMVLDYHHHICNCKEVVNICNYYEEIFKTWKNITPKVHFSTPKNKTKKDIRSHHEYINVDDFINFIEEIKLYKQNIDVMIEAKGKDEALFRLVRNLKYKTNYKFIDDTTFEVR